LSKFLVANVSLPRRNLVILSKVHSSFKAANLSAENSDGNISCGWGLALKGWFTRFVFTACVHGPWHSWCEPV